VTVLARDGDETFEADAETEQILLQAIDQCNRGNTMPMGGFFPSRAVATERHTRSASSLPCETRVERQAFNC